MTVSHHARSFRATRRVPGEFCLELEAAGCSMTSGSGRILPRRAAIRAKGGGVDRLGAMAYIRAPFAGPGEKGGIAGWSSPVARQAHNLKVTGSNPVPATKLVRKIKCLKGALSGAFFVGGSLEALWKQEGA